MGGGAKHHQGRGFAGAPLPSAGGENKGHTAQLNPEYLERKVCGGRGGGGGRVLISKVRKNLTLCSRERYTGFGTGGRAKGGNIRKEGEEGEQRQDKWLEGEVCTGAKLEKGIEEQAGRFVKGVPRKTFGERRTRERKEKIANAMSRGGDIGRRTSRGRGVRKQPRVIEGNLG